jgi:hypothetical protein
MHDIIIVIFDGHLISAEDDVGRHSAIALTAIIIVRIGHKLIVRSSNPPK